MIDWNAIDTVLLDMDGTLLDLHFDNYFWLTHLPKRYAEHHNLCPDESSQTLQRLFLEKRGTLDWYCLTFWSQQLRIDINKLKWEVKHLIAERPGAVLFLKALKLFAKQRILITNAHPDSLQLKLSLTEISSQLEKVISSHQYGFPKESQQFWKQLQQETFFDPERTLFIDDSLTILASAQQFGIKQLLFISQPDSQQPAQANKDFPSIRNFDEIIPLTGIETGAIK